MTRPNYTNSSTITSSQKRNAQSDDSTLDDECQEDYELPKSPDEFAITRELSERARAAE